MAKKEIDKIVEERYQAIVKTLTDYNRWSPLYEMQARQLAQAMVRKENMEETLYLEGFTRLETTTAGNEKLVNHPLVDAVTKLDRAIMLMQTSLGMNFDANPQRIKDGKPKTDSEQSDIDAIFKNRMR